ncbi:hypothetical protein VOLCADRAFT_99704 [Volvox carteri f. nagariensis]|uniref:SET domain-containing protein n=1 Tax=Volvox carteri f. nagariensis TaxID=3068 RepID=D8UIF3_VOLCA|nr:uncharacterized protein VOLCADRAFT_99704 [Volvox carteri f. nagariensis]EFJ40499.1 hypothetical protein VOLCADRAFT_99704 [Volvox carteri f. nagariensis]|eukprot:XP_002958423.1 hypothetical protein VOLCADRAFT_99704 [Volvox carteri f. nagariensis]
MHSTRFTRTFRSGIDLAPPVTPAVAPSCSFGCIAKPVPFVSSLRLSASKRSEDTHTEFQTPGTGESAQASSSAPAWGAALASKARKANAAAGLRSQRSQHQGKTLETVEAVAVTPHGSAFGSKGSAAGSDGPVVVVQPQEPYLRPQPPPPSSSSSSSSPWTSRSSTTSGSRAAPAGEGSAAPPPLTFVRPPGRPMGRSTAAGSAIPSSARKTQAGARGAGPGNGSSTSGSGSGNSVSYDPFTKARVPTRAGTAPPPAVPPPWLATAAAAKRASAAAAAGGGGGMSPPPRFSAAPPPRSRSTAMPDAKSTPRSAANAAAAAAAAAAVAAAAKPQAVAPGSTGDGDPPLSVSFSQVMGRQKRSKGDGQTDQDLDPAESNVVDYTWEPDPDLDVIEADAAAAAEEERRRRELQRDVARERRELREAAEAAVQRSYAPGAPPPPPFVGSVKAERIPGRGFGLVADEDVAAGQLLLVAVPAVCSRGPGGGLPKMRPLLSEALRLLRLADGIPSSSSSSSSSSSAAAAAADGAALASLFWGAPRPSSSRPPADLAAWRVRQSELLSTPAAAAKATATAAGKSGMTWTQQRVMSLLQLNLVAEETQDGAAAVANSEPLTSRMGVWPEVALINHSCGPNAVAVMLYDRLVVRATRRIPRGREVLLNWLGSQGALAPARERRAQLSQMYDFACRCARCRLEGSEAVSLPFLYSDAERGSEEALEAMEHVGLSIPPPPA